MVNVVPFQIFQEIAESLKVSVNVTSTTKSGNKTTLFCACDENIGSFVLCNCGALQGYYEILERYANRIVIQYSGASTAGTIKTYPYFQWGNLKDGKISINKINEFPLIYLILPLPYTLNVDKKSSIFIESSFKFLFIDKYELRNGYKTITEDVFNSTVLVVTLPSFVFVLSFSLSVFFTVFL